MEKLLNFLKCTADENRFKILKLLLDGSHCVCQLQEILDKSQSSISQHLSYFKKLDLLNEEKSGKWTYYSIDRNIYDNYLAELIALKSKSLKELDLLETKRNLDTLDSPAEIRTKSKKGGCC